MKTPDPNEPTAAERASIDRRIGLLPIMRRDQPGVIDWPRIAARLAEALTATTARLSSDPTLTEGDLERIDRAGIALREFDAARSANGD